ncbi:hypothetical protein GGI04_005404, partial [Coemansia thaxteri]
MCSVRATVILLFLCALASTVFAEGPTEQTTVLTTDTFEVFDNLATNEFTQRGEIRVLQNETALYQPVASKYAQQLADIGEQELSAELYYT